MPVRTGADYSRDIDIGKATSDSTNAEIISKLTEMDSKLYNVSQGTDSLLDAILAQENEPSTLLGMTDQIVTAISSKGTKLTIVTVRKSLVAAGDYEAEDVLSESATAGTAWKFTDLAEIGGAGYLVGAQVIWETTALTPRISLYVYSKIPTSNKNDNAGNSLAIADYPFFVGVINFNQLEDLGGASSQVATPNTTDSKLPLLFQCQAGSSSLHVIAVLRDAVTGESAGAEMIIKLASERY